MEEPDDRAAGCYESKHSWMGGVLVFDIAALLHEELMADRNLQTVGETPKVKALERRTRGRELFCRSNSMAATSAGPLSVVRVAILSNGMPNLDRAASMLAAWFAAVLDSV